MSGSLPQTTANAVAEDFSRAIESHQKGKLDRAKRGYKRVLKKAPDHASAIHMLGVLDLQRGNPRAASELIEKSVALNPTMAAAHYNLARCYKALNEFEAAARSVEQCLTITPDDLDALILYGNTLTELDRKEESVAAFSSALKIDPALDPVRAERLSLNLALGNENAIVADLEYLAANAKEPALMLREVAKRRVDQNSRPDALRVLKKALDVDPTDRLTRSSYAGILIDLERNGEALPLVQGLLDEYPDDLMARLKMGFLLANMKRFKDALPILEHVYAHRPNDEALLLKLAFTYQTLERFDDAIAHYEKLKILAPTEARTWANLVGLYIGIEEYEKAIEEGMEALRINPDVEQSYLNMAVLFQRFGDFDRAADLYRRALEINPDYSTAGSNLSHLLLAHGHIEDGWDLYAHGFNAGLRTPLRQFNTGHWQGEDISDRSILVWKEQGIGDDLRFMSCIPDLIARAGQVIIETDKRLVSLYQRSFPEAIVREERTKPSLVPYGPPDFSTTTPAGQLATHFRRSLADFPAEDGYLKPDPQRVAYWREKVEAAGDGIRVGLAWRSMHRNVTRNRTYSQLEDWARLIATPGITAINLQYDDPSDEVKALAEKTGLTLHVMEGLNLKDELDEAAALTKACDLVISAGTSVADMAAAVGTPAIFYGEAHHPMQLGTDHFPWYPSARFVGIEAKQPISEIVDIITRDVQAFAERYRTGEFS
ncbi:tetratricopeptide repeat protein [Pyruvatibacter sp.]|uniref:tetratricopeptide repeat protein n=1 Tax=Pyruvatibacter sp. TaxID=1981328 RepID=UPI0032EBBD91